MSHCATFTLPDGRINIVRPNAVLVAALQAATIEAAIVLLDEKNQGLTLAVVKPLYDAMAARTELEAIRVIAKRDAPRVAMLHGFLPTDVANLATHEATGLLEPEGLATSRRFRACWRQAGTARPAVDMPLARIQRMNEVRTQRAPKLTKSDVDLLKAQEAADLARQTALKTYRQKLRDLPATEQPAVDACATPEALDAWRPTWPVDPA